MNQLLIQSLSFSLQTVQESIKKDDEDNQSVNLSIREYSSVFSFNIIAEIAFGYKFDESSSNLYFKALRDQVDALLNVKNRILLTFLPFLRYVPYIKDKLTNKYRFSIYQYCHKNHKKKDITKRKTSQ